jgi:hypothetical protein
MLLKVELLLPLDKVQCLLFQNTRCHRTRTELVSSFDFIGLPRDSID